MKLLTLFEEFESYRKSNSFEGQPKNLYDSMNYIMQLGGKRVRPLLCLASYLSRKGTAINSDILQFALGVETFHNFSLVHDDIMDNAYFRRGQATVHQKWDTNLAILSGDNLLIKSVQLIAIPSPHLQTILSLFLDMAKEVCEGQQMDMNFPTQHNVTEEEYLKMIKLKTAVLLGFAAQGAALLAGVGTHDATLFYKLAIETGLAFQLKDDYLDTFGKEELIGKKVGGDILEEKNTWLWIKARTANPQFLTAAQAQSGEEKIQYVQQIYTQHKLDAELTEKINWHYEQAEFYLQQLEMNGYDMSYMRDLIAMLENRIH